MNFFNSLILVLNNLFHFQLYAYIENIFDVEQPFNTPTISLKAYKTDETLLKFNPSLRMTQIGKPVPVKARLLSTKKSDVQCDVSELRCDLEKNVDSLSSLASFPINQNAGDFVLVFPRIKFAYSAHISHIFTPTKSQYTWLLHVGVDGDFNTTANSSYALKVGIAEDGIRAVIPAQGLLDAFDTADKKATLKVVMKKNFEGLKEIPPEACDIQRCYGYHLKLATAQKQQNRKRRQAPEDEELELLPTSTEKAIEFKSNYMGDIGADLAIAPNTIEFSNIFANFSSLVADNWAVLAFMCFCVALFIVGSIFLWHFDRSDLKQWAYLPLIGNKPINNYKYLISICHRGVKNWNENDQVWLRLVGNVDATKWRLMKDKERKNFKISHPENFILTCNYSLGDQMKLEMAITPKNGKRSSTSFSTVVDEVIVVDVGKCKKFRFKINKRLQCDGKTRTFSLPTDDDLKDWSYLMKRRARMDFSENHPWYSILSRPLPSDWTRVERLACVVSALFMAMLVNCMFYGKEAEAPQAGATLGMISISWFTVWTSLIGGIIIIPPTFFMGFVFKKVKRRSAEKSDLMTIFNLKMEALEGDEEKEIMTEEERQEWEKKKKKKPFQLPYYFIIVAWFCKFFI